MRAVARVKVRGALAGGDAAGGLDAGCREPMMGGQGTGARVAGFWWRAGWVGVTCRGGVVAVATATLIYACRGRRSVIRRMVPLTKYERRVCVHSARGDRSRGGERPGRPPVAAGSLAGQGRRGPGAPGHARGGHRRWLPSCCGQLVISAQTNPASSRATAVMATAGGLPRAVIVLYLAH